MIVRSKRTGHREYGTWDTPLPAASLKSRLCLAVTVATGVAVPAVVYQIVQGDSVRYPAAGRIQQRRRRDAVATVDKLGGNWIIVRSHDTAARDEIGGASESEANAPSSNREFWTGDGWAGQYGLARYFARKEEAEAYLARHWHEME